MGEVYLAEDTKLHRRVALKTLSPELAKDKDRVERFEREARAAAALNHPNIVTIHSVETDGDVAFLTLELLEGQTLADTLPPSGLPLDRLLSIAIPLADAVGAAHQRGIVHRDLKPPNVMITNDSRVKVLDFGLAKLRDEPQFAEQTLGPTRALTGEGRILGTVAYMSPEQAEGKAVDQRSDVFSLGVMLYEMASGERPFKGDTAMSILTAIMRDTPRPISEIKRDLPPDFARIVRRCLAKDPEDRYQTAKDLRNDLRGLREDLQSGERASVIGSSSAAGAPASTPGVNVSPATKSSPRSLVVAPVAALIVIAVAIGGWRLLSSGGAPAATTPEPFATIALTRLTTTGTAGLAAVSQDGRYVAHVVSDDKGSSLWLRQVSTSSNVEIVPPADVRYSAVTFSPNGDYVFYVSYPRGSEYAALRQVPVLGGGARKLVDDIDTAPTFSPDGKRMAFVRGYPGGGAGVMVGTSDGAELHELSSRKPPLSYQIPLQTVSWSPDGKVIAVIAVDNTKLSAQVALLDTASGTEHFVGPQWRTINSLTWMVDGRSLILTAQELGGESGTQIWLVENPSGTVRRLTNDLSTYSGMSLSRDGHSLVTVRAEQRASIWLAPLEGGEAPHAIPNGGADDGVHGLSWTPDGRIVYAASSSGNSDIWIMNADGSNRVQLTTSRADDTLPIVTPDGKYIVFVSERENTRGLWRMDISGGDQRRISDHSVNPTPFGPSVSDDSQWVFFTDDRRVNLKTDMQGRSTVPLFDPAATLPEALHDPHPTPDMTAVTAHYSDPKLGERLAIVPLADPSNAKLFATVRNNALFSSDGRSLIYFDGQRGVGNLWRQPVAGGSPTQLTHFDSLAMFHHALAPDHQRAAMVRGATISDVILIADRAGEKRE
jgi:serine/threonine protein kinase/Tol biopolymer transport system component